MDKQKGSLTIEATFAMMFFFIIFLAFTTVAEYTETQNLVRHSLDQMALSMSAKNYQYSQVHAIVESGTGIKASDISEVVGWFNFTDVDDMYGLGKTFRLPYSDESKAVDKTKYTVWSDAQMLRDAARMFAYYYCDLSFSASNSMSYDDIVNHIQDNTNLKDVKFTGCGGSKSDEIMDDGTLNVAITYSIKAGISFDTVMLQKDNPWKFTNQVSMKLMT